MQAPQVRAEIDWVSILEHYDQLMEMTDSPVVALNRAVVVMKVHGAEASLAALTPLAGNNALQKYHLLPATQGHVLAALGRLDEAKAAFSAALECDCTLPEKRFLQRQLAMVSMQRHSSGPSGKKLRGRAFVKLSDFNLLHDSG